MRFFFYLYSDQVDPRGLSRFRPFQFDQEATTFMYVSFTYHGADYE